MSKPQALPWSPSSPAYDADKAAAYTFDLDQAKTLLAQSGVTTPKLDLTWSSATSDWSIIAQIYQADLAKIGIDLSLKRLEGSAYLRLMQSGAFTGLMIGLGLNGHMHPSTMVLGPYYGPTINYSHFTDEAYTQLADRVLNQTDPTRQKALAAELNDYWLDRRGQCRSCRVRYARRRATRCVGCATTCMRRWCFQRSGSRQRDGACNCA